MFLLFSAPIPPLHQFPSCMKRSLVPQPCDFSCCVLGYEMEKRAIMQQYGARAYCPGVIQPVNNRYS